LQFTAFNIFFWYLGERRGQIPDGYDLIPATALTITGPAAAPEKEHPD
jgi:hypothetical protein